MLNIRNLFVQVYFIVDIFNFVNFDKLIASIKIYVDTVYEFE